MALIKIETIETAQGKVKQAYDALLQTIPFIPKPAQMMSASPGLMDGFMLGMRYFFEHPHLKMQTLAWIRYLIAFNSEYPYCIDLNGQLVQMMSQLSTEQMAEIRKDPSKAPLEPRERDLLLFVLKAIQSPETVEKADVERLIAQGWTESDVFDATWHGATMILSGIMFNAFKMND
jgi:hypothetical protein